MNEVTTEHDLYRSALSLVSWQTVLEYRGAVQASFRLTSSDLTEKLPPIIRRWREMRTNVTQMQPPDFAEKATPCPVPPVCRPAFELDRRAIVGLLGWQSHRTPLPENLLLVSDADQGMAITAYFLKLVGAFNDQKSILPQSMTEMFLLGDVVRLYPELIKNTTPLRPLTGLRDAKIPTQKEFCEELARQCIEHLNGVELNPNDNDLANEEWADLAPALGVVRLMHKYCTRKVIQAARSESQISEYNELFDESLAFVNDPRLSSLAYVEWFNHGLLEEDNFSAAVMVLGIHKSLCRLMERSAAIAPMFANFDGRTEKLGNYYRTHRIQNILQFDPTDARGVTPEAVESETGKGGFLPADLRPIDIAYRQVAAQASVGARERLQIKIGQLADFQKTRSQ